jgi:phenylalanyl-tRNA synthetase alpha chain
MDEQMSFYVGRHAPAAHADDRAAGPVLQRRQPPLRIATIGRCFRYENMDATHSHTFHQVDGFSVDEGLSLADLKGCWRR